MTGSTTGVREARIDELAPLTATLADAFADEPIARWLTPNRRRRDKRLRRLFAVELEHYVFPAGRVLTTDDFRGASLELPPGRWEMAVPLSGAIGFVRAFGLQMPRASRLQVFFERHHLEEPHYYLRSVGVATRFQGQGIGTALLRPTLDRCDREGVPAYLEASTERSAALYERLGFVHLGELKIPGGPPFWPMRRPPAAERRGDQVAGDQVGPAEQTRNPDRQAVPHRYHDAVVVRDGDTGVLERSGGARECERQRAPFSPEMGLRRP